MEWNGLFLLLSNTVIILNNASRIKTEGLSGKKFEALREHYFIVETWYQILILYQILLSTPFLFYKQSIFDPRPENCLSFSKNRLKNLNVTVVFYRDT